MNLETPLDAARLEQLADPVAHEVANEGDAEPDDEHVEPRAEEAATGKHGTRRANEEVRRAYLGEDF